MKRRTGRQIVGLGALLLLSLPAAAWSQAPKPVPRPALELAAGQLQSAAVAADQAAADERHHLRLDEARDAILDEDPESARLMLEAFAATTTMSPAVRNRVEALLGQAAMSRGLGESALRHLDKIDPALVPSANHLKWLKAQAAADAAQFNRAAELYQEIIDTERDSRILHFARAGLADALFLANHDDAAGAAYDALLKLYPRYPQRHVAMYRRAQIHMHQGQHKESAALFHKLWWEQPWKEQGVKARMLLQAEPLASVRPAMPDMETLFERAEHLRKQKHWDVAEQALGELLTMAQNQGATTIFKNKIRIQQALVSLDRQDYETALPRWQALAARIDARQKNAGLDFDFVFRQLQRCHHRMGNSETAEALLKRRMARRPAGVRNRAYGKFYWEDGQYKKSLAHYERVWRKDDRKGWDYPFALYKAGKYKTADRLFNVLLNNREEWGREVSYQQILYWIGRTRQQRGMKASARNIYQTLVEGHGLSYYGHQARSRLIEMDRMRDGATEGVAAKPVAIDEATVTGQARVYWNGPDAEPAPDNAELFARERIDPYESPLPLQGALRRAAAAHGDLWPALERASWLHDAGLVWEAQWELRLATQEFRGLEHAFRKGARPALNRPVKLTRYKKWGHYIDRRRSGPKGFWGLPGKDFLYPVPKDADGKKALYEHQMAVRARMPVLIGDMRQAMMEAGDHHFARLMRFGRGPWSRHDPAGEYKHHWTEFHPRAFARHVTRYAEGQDLNPYLVWSIMTVESGYNPDTVSHADARGLLQVIPKTGNKVAAAMREDNFGPYDLMTPDTSLRHGAWYFARLLDKFKGQEPLAIASYNGGPHNVQRWLTHKHDQPLDEFVEEIPFNEARRYTKRVLRYLGVFLRLYEGNKGLYIGNNINGDSLVVPRY